MTVFALSFPLGERVLDVVADDLKSATPGDLALT
jgi:hypothetical protein